MCNKAIISLILKFRNNDGAAFMQIYNVFKKLIIHYGNRMYCEDGISELTLFLVELLHRLDLSQFKADTSFGVQKYIAVALRNRFIDISKKGRGEIFKTQLLEDTAVFLDQYREEKILLSQALSALSDKKKQVLYYKFFEGYADTEIAEIMGISRQAVNKIKRRAFNEIKNFYK